MRPSVPRVVLVYGLLGLIPFLAPPVVGALLPGVRTLAGLVLAIYGALILSFLGGARWGLEISSPEPRSVVISLAMLPTLAGLILLLLPSSQLHIQLLGLAFGLGLHWLWDLRGAGLPSWYGGLRTLLTAGAAGGLIAGAFMLTP